MVHRSLQLNYNSAAVLSFLGDARAEEVSGAAVDAGDALGDGLLVERVDELVVHLVVEAGRALLIRSGGIQNML